MNRLKKSSLRIKDLGKTKSRLEYDFEIKSIHDDEEDDKFFIFEGFASTFGNIDHDGDIMVRGAFKESLEKRMPVVLWQHNTREPIGMPIELKETDQGLFIRARLPKDDTFVTGRVIPQMKVGSVTKMSIGFFILDSEDELIEGRRVTHIKKVELLEFSLVTFASNEQASVTGMKSLQEIDDAKALRSWLSEELGLSIKERDTLISKVKSFFGSDEPNLDDENENTPDEVFSMASMDLAIDSIKGPKPDVMSTLDKAILEIKNNG